MRHRFLHSECVRLSFIYCVSLKLAPLIIKTSKTYVLTFIDRFCTRLGCIIRFHKYYLFKGSAPGTKTLDESHDFASLTHEEMDQHFMEVSKDCPSSDSIPKFKHDFRSLIHDDKFEKSIRRNLKKQDFKSRSQSRNTSSSMMSDDTPEGLKKPMTKIEWIQTRLKLGKKGKIMSKVGLLKFGLELRQYKNDWIAKINLFVLK